MKENREERIMKKGVEEQYNEIIYTVGSKYEGKCLDEEQIEELYYTLISKFKECGWGVSESTETNPSSMMVLRPPNENLWSLIYVNPVFGLISKEDKQARTEFSQSLMDSMWGC